MISHLLYLRGPPGMAHICHANFLQSGTPGNANSSLHQSGVLVASVFHITHLHNSPTGGSGGDSSSLELSTNLVRKEVTPGSNSSGLPRSKSSGVSSSPMEPIFSLVSGWLVGMLLNDIDTASFCILWTHMFRSLCFSHRSLQPPATSRKGGSLAFLSPLQGQQQQPMPFGELLSCWPGSVPLRFPSLQVLHSFGVRGLWIRALW